jgi:malate synthase
MAMLDFEDSMKPSWKNVVDGVYNVIGAAKGDLSFHKKNQSGEVEKTYKLDPTDMAGVMVRVRGLHLNEANVMIDGTPISGGLFDLASCAFLAARDFISRGKTPKFYVPKCEHFMEARWWNRLFSAIEENIGLDNGTLRATFLIETLPAAFQIEEILYELKDHAVGLNVGRWDKIFSDIKVLRMHADRISPDRATINMQKFWMDNYAKRLVKICHTHGAFAIGGMSAFTPGKDESTVKAQTQKVLSDKNNEFQSGHDGCWVSHPYFIAPALKAFPKKNQLDEYLPNFDKYPDLLMDGKGPKTINGLRTNIRVGIAYLHGWNRDLGCVAWDNLMEDLATLEISRAQTWQWLHHEVTLDSGEKVTKDLILQLFNEELEKIMSELSIERATDKALEFSKSMEQSFEMFTSNKLDEFLSLSSEIEK